MPFVAIWMYLEINKLSEVSQTKTTVIYHLYVESNKNGTKELIYKTEQTQRFWNQTYGYQRGNMVKDKLGGWD